MNQASQTHEESLLRDKIEQALKKKIMSLSLKGKGAVNNAYLVETTEGSKYIFKIERTDKEFQPQNTLSVEADTILKLCDMGIETLLPKVVFMSADPSMYGYEYIEGDLLRSVWPSLIEAEKVGVCMELGHFHADIGKKFAESDAAAAGLTIDYSTGFHPEVAADYEKILANPDVPPGWKVLAQKAKGIFDETNHDNVFQFLHNDSHHENILIKDKKIAGIIDFGNAEYGDVTKEFSRYIRDFPDHFQYIVESYEENSGHSLSMPHLISNAFVNGLIDYVESYAKGGEGRMAAEKAVAKYEQLLTSRML